MSLFKNIKTKQLKLSLLLIFVFVLFVSSFFVFFPFSWQQIAMALTGNYNKNLGDSLDATDWNNLDDDFVAKSGDTMQGNLNMGGNNIINLADPINDSDVASKAYVDSQVNTGSANITNTGGENLKMVCGTTSYGATNWIVAAANTITVVVDTTIANFTNNEVIYFASLNGDDGMYKAVGINNIYDSNATDFRLYLSNNDLTAFNTVTVRDTWKWHIKWCGIGK
ncbi:hypothetical protein KAI65_05660 [Candidatus Parcubacteria bacterium]|nr:hypothetical protein [Candidatus Parcubacteria bacterium]